MFSILIPAYNEANRIGETCRAIVAAFAAEGITDWEILVINDGSTDGTAAVLESLEREEPRIRQRLNDLPGGFGFAVRCGLDHFAGDAVAIVMADGSDDPADIIRYYRAIAAGAECVFGSRFVPGAVVVGYPFVKLVINRIVNTATRLLFRIPHNDLTNAFKCYRREVVEGMRPFVANHFNLTLELPLKAIVRGYTFVMMPIA
jgi:dolichol-phosphate mannosyltransferase